MVWVCLQTLRNNPNTKIERLHVVVTITLKELDKWNKGHEKKKEKREPFKRKTVEWWREWFFIRKNVNVKADLDRWKNG